MCESIYCAKHKITSHTHVPLSKIHVRKHAVTASKQSREEGGKNTSEKIIIIMLRNSVEKRHQSHYYANGVDFIRWFCVSTVSITRVFRLVSCRVCVTQNEKKENVHDDKPQTSRKVSHAKYQILSSISVFCVTCSGRRP